MRILLLALLVAWPCAAACQQPGSTRRQLPAFRMFGGVEYSNAQSSAVRVNGAVVYSRTIGGSRAEGRRRSRLRLSAAAEPTSGLSTRQHFHCQPDTIVPAPIFFGGPVVPVQEFVCPRDRLIRSISLSGNDTLFTSLLIRDSISYATGRIWRGSFQLGFERELADEFFVELVGSAGFQTNPSGFRQLGAFYVIGVGAACIDRGESVDFRARLSYGLAQDFTDSATTVTVGQTRVAALELAQKPRIHVLLQVEPLPGYVLRVFAQLLNGPGIAQLAVLKSIDLKQLLDSVMEAR